MTEAQRLQRTSKLLLPVDHAIRELRPGLSLQLWRPEDRKGIRRRGRIGSANNRARTFAMRLLRRLELEQGAT